MNVDNLEIDLGDPPTPNAWSHITTEMCDPRTPRRGHQFKALLRDCLRSTFNVNKGFDKDFVRRDMDAMKSASDGDSRLAVHTQCMGEVADLYEGWPDAPPASITKKRARDESGENKALNASKKRTAPGYGHGDGGLGPPPKKAPTLKSAQAKLHSLSSQLRQATEELDTLNAEHGTFSQRRKKGEVISEDVVTTNSKATSVAFSRVTAARRHVERQRGVVEGLEANLHQA